MTYNFRLMHKAGIKQAVDACAEAGIGLTAMKTQGGGPVKKESESELKMAGRFLEKGYTGAQAKLKAVWENQQIASICSHMDDLNKLAANVDAELNRIPLSSSDRRLLARYGRETGSHYCAGCRSLCEPALSGRVPVADAMRCLMYHHSYGDHAMGRDTFAEVRRSWPASLDGIDFSGAEARCPRRLPIGDLMKEAETVFS